MRSPLTGMFFMLELTHDINALPALPCGSVAGLGVTVLLMNPPGHLAGEGKREADRDHHPR
jgi:H+/Cl- antiporter ClcA